LIFTRCFQGLLVRGKMGSGGGRVMSSRTPVQRFKCIITMFMVLIFLSVYLLSLFVFSSKIKNTLKGTLSVA